MITLIVSFLKISSLPYSKLGFKWQCFSAKPNRKMKLHCYSNDQLKSWKKLKSRLLKLSSSCFFSIYIVHTPLLPILHVILTNYTLSNFHSSTYLSFRGSDMLFLSNTSLRKNSLTTHFIPLRALCLITNPNAIAVSTSPYALTRQCSISPNVPLASFPKQTEMPAANPTA